MDTIAQHYSLDALCDRAQDIAVGGYSRHATIREIEDLFEPTLGTGPIAIADFLHSNPSFPTRELTGLYRYSRIGQTLLARNVRPILCMYDLPLPHEEAAREGGGWTFKLSRPLRSIPVLSRRDVPYFRQQVDEVSSLPGTLSEDNAAFISWLMQFSTQGCASQAILHAKLHWYQKHMADHEPPIQLVLASSLVEPIHGVCRLLDQWGINWISYFAGSGRRVFREIDCIGLTQHLWHEDCGGQLRCRLTGAVCSQREICMKPFWSLAPSMDLFYVAVLLLRGVLHFGNSYGRAPNLAARINDAKDFSTSYYQLAPDNHNSLPLPHKKLRTSNGHGYYSLVSIYQQVEPARDIARMAIRTAESGIAGN